MQTGETLICSYSDNAANTLQLTFEDFKTLSVKSAGVAEDDVVRAVVNGVKSLPFKVGDEIAGIKIARIKPGNGNKVFVIGTDMKNRLTPFAEALERQGYKVELFSAKYQTKPIIIEGKSYTWGEIETGWKEMMELKYPNQTWIPYDDINALKNTQGTLMYKANQQFIQRALQEGTIIDIGKTYDSHFYDMEILNVFK